jgi:hypothetical protein
MFGPHGAVVIALITTPEEDRKRIITALRHLKYIPQNEYVEEISVDCSCIPSDEVLAETLGNLDKYERHE